MIRRCRPLLGTFVEVTADREDAIDRAFAAVEHVHRLMSAHEPESDVSRINRFGDLGAVEVHEWTGRVIERALFWSRHSEGAFDVVRAGKMALESGLLPRHTDQPLPEAAHWTWLEFQGRSVRLLKPGCVDLGGIAKGFAVDRAVDAMVTAGATLGLVNAGGDLRAFGPRSWPVEIVDPATRKPIVSIDLQDAALATSAGLPSENGVELRHLPVVDPQWVSVTVGAASCTDADALTKVAWAGEAKAPGLLDKAGAQAFAISQNGSVKEIAEGTLA